MRKSQPVKFESLMPGDQFELPGTEIVFTKTEPQETTNASHPDHGNVVVSPDCEVHALPKEPC